MRSACANRGGVVSNRPDAPHGARKGLREIVHDRVWHRRDHEAELQAVVEALEAMVVEKRERQPQTDRSQIGERLARRPIGNLLVARGYIHDFDLQLALQKQAQAPGKRLGEVLIDMGLVTDRDIAEVLSEQMKLPMMPLARVRCDPEVLSMISRHDAHRLRAIPAYRTQERAIAVAMADPTDQLAIDTLAQLLRAPLELYVAPQSDILKYVDATGTDLIP
jgi:hypothetical protein